VLDTDTDMGICGSRLLMNMSMNIVEDLPDLRLVNRNMGQKSIVLLEDPPHVDLTEDIMKDGILTIIMVPQKQPLLERHGFEITQSFGSTGLGEVDISQMVQGITGLHVVGNVVQHTLVHLLD